MPNITILFAVLLIILGIAGYIPTSAPTALIPAAVGVLLLICGVLARREGMRKHAMHAAAAIALIGLLGSVGGLIKLPTVINGTATGRPAAIIAQSIMAVLMTVFVALCVRSFIAARKNRIG
jgi:hypothetical protein